MNEFLIGHKVRIHHYPDWSGSAFLHYGDEEFRIPGEAARLIVQALRRAQTQSTELLETSFECARCGKPAGTAWVDPTDDDALARALCPACQ